MWHWVLEAVERQPLFKLVGHVNWDSGAKMNCILGCCSINEHLHISSDSANCHVQVMDRIQGLNGLQLPWEGDNLTTANRRKLGIFKGSLLKLLDRDPAERPSMEEFCDACTRVLAGSTSVHL
jgi:hypothetical protein